MIRFIHISDTHIGDTKDFLIQGANPFDGTKKLIEELNKLPFRPDFIVHTGDVAASNGESESYTLAQKLFNEISTPTYFVTGNHDKSGPMKKMMKYGEKIDLLDAETNMYQFDVNGIRNIVLDARGPDAIDPHGIVSDEQLKILEKAIKDGTMPLAIYIHFFPLPLDNAWLDQDMLLLNGSTFHKLLKKHASRIRGVFTGHVHRGMQYYRDGILYASVGSSFLQFSALAKQVAPVFEKEKIGFYNVVSITPDSTIIKEHFYDY